MDDKDNLKPEYDAARAIMGGDWRMPTRKEFEELLSGTTNKWIANYNGTGVKGWKFTGSNGNSIFIPAAGYGCEGSVIYVGNDGFVWSSSLNTSNPYGAWLLNFSPDDCGMGYDGRSNGMSVRGVRK